MLSPRRRAMRTLAAAAALAVLTAACGGGGDGPAPTSVLVDYSHDEFASFFIRNFPWKVQARQGDEIVFRQTWTGEPHTITGGKLVDRYLAEVEPYIDLVQAGRADEVPDEPPKDIAKLEEDLPWVFTDSDELNQTAAQPCYLTRGEVPKDGKPCPERRQPAFNGKQSYFNSGVIPYEGPRGNEFRIKLAQNIEPGTYWFYCAVHGPFQSTELEVKPADARVPSAAQVARRARSEVQEIAEPMIDAFRDAQDRKLTVRVGGERRTIRGNFAGITTSDQHDGAVNEFVPKKIVVDRGEKITWNLMGFHTISFGVPRYFPIITFGKDGSVERNPRLDPPAGGAKRFDIPEDERYGEGDDPVSFDGGSYDGDGFWSSGAIDAQPWLEYSMRITEPGTYRYACLIHPPMVGTLEVR